MTSIKKGDLTLIGEGLRQPPYRVKEGMVGFCKKCDGELSSLAYYQVEGTWLVAARCRACHQLILIRYDGDWVWLEDLPLQEVDGPVETEVKVSEIPQEKLSQVFTPAEIRDMLACERGLPYVRQNLYRARSKFQRFYDLHGITIKIGNK